MQLKQHHVRARGYSPHKHDRDAPPHEVAQEEVYFFKLRPENGFGNQYIYSTAGEPVARTYPR